MELRRHSCVLPSNAPAFDDVGLSGRAVTGRVLQERCGNRQHEYLDSDLSARRKYMPSSPVENLYRNGLSTYISSHSGIASHPDCKSEEQINRETARVWRLLQECQPYLKYRDKPQKDAREDVKWPEHMEYAFFRGLVKYEPMGRRKLMLQGKPRGRNELVADSIEKDTGEARTRKQVSSHIQVLKEKLKDEPKILKYMSKEDLSCRANRHAGADVSSARSRHAVLSSKHRRPSTQYTFQQAYQLPTSNRYVTPFDFVMYVRDPREDPPKHFFTFTKFPKDSSAKLEDAYVRDTRQWRTLYPSLSHVPIDRYQDCDIIVCDATIAVMTDALPKNFELAIQLEFQGESYRTNFDSFSFRTSFFDTKPVTHPSSIKTNPNEPDANEPDTDFQFNAHFSGSYVTPPLPFCSKFWAYKMHSLSMQLRRARVHSDPDDRSKMELQVRISLEHLTATQEIFAVPKGGTKPVRLAAIFWRFSQTNGREEGRAMWRSVIYSPGQRQTQAQPVVSVPLPRATEPAVAVDEIYPVTQQQQTVYPNLSFDLPPHAHPVYEAMSMNPPDHSHNFDLDTLSTMALEGAFAPHSAPPPVSLPSANAEGLYPEHQHAHSHGIPSLTHSYDSSIDLSQSVPHSHHQHHLSSLHHPTMGMSHNDLDFTGGSINIHLEPAIELGGGGGGGGGGGSISASTAYSDFGIQGFNPATPQLHEFAEQHAHAGGQQEHGTVQNTNIFNVDSAFARPWGSYQELMERLEGCEGVAVGGEHAVDTEGGHESGQGLWKLQSPFAEDAGAGCDDGRVIKEERAAREDVFGLGIVRGEGRRDVGGHRGQGLGHGHGRLGGY